MQTQTHERQFGASGTPLAVVSREEYHADSGLAAALHADITKPTTGDIYFSITLPEEVVRDDGGGGDEKTWYEQLVSVLQRMASEKPVACCHDPGGHAYAILLPRTAYSPAHAVLFERLLRVRRKDVPLLNRLVLAAATCCYAPMQLILDQVALLRRSGASLAPDFADRFLYMSLSSSSSTGDDTYAARVLEGVLDMAQEDSVPSRAGLDEALDRCARYDLPDILGYVLSKGGTDPLSNADDNSTKFCMVAYEHGSVRALARLLLLLFSSATEGRRADGLVAGLHSSVCRPRCFCREKRAEENEIHCARAVERAGYGWIYDDADVLDRYIELKKEDMVRFVAERRARLGKGVPLRSFALAYRLGLVGILSLLLPLLRMSEANRRDAASEMILGGGEYTYMYTKPDATEIECARAVERAGYGWIYDDADVLDKYIEMKKEDMVRFVAERRARFGKGVPLRSAALAYKSGCDGILSLLLPFLRMDEADCRNASSEILGGGKYTYMYTKPGAAEIDCARVVERAGYGWIYDDADVLDKYIEMKKEDMVRFVAERRARVGKGVPLRSVVLAFRRGYAGILSLLLPLLRMSEADRRAVSSDIFIDEHTYVTTDATGVDCARVLESHGMGHVYDSERALERVFWSSLVFTTAEKSEPALLGYVLDRFRRQGWQIPPELAAIACRRAKNNWCLRMLVERGGRGRSLIGRISSSDVGYRMMAFRGVKHDLQGGARGLLACAIENYLEYRCTDVLDYVLSLEDVRADDVRAWLAAVNDKPACDLNDKHDEVRQALEAAHRRKTEAEQQRRGLSPARENDNSRSHFVSENDGDGDEAKSMLHKPNPDPPPKRHEEGMPPRRSLQQQQQQQQQRRSKKKVGEARCILC